MLYFNLALAKAFGLAAIDMVCLDFRNEAILQQECRQGRELGFSGKVPAAGAPLSRTPV